MDGKEAPPQGTRIRKEKREETKERRKQKIPHNKNNKQGEVAMGMGRWDADDWAAYAKTTKGRATGAIFTAHVMDDDLDPKKNKPRESCDSDANPNATPIIIALDVTGSMGELAGIIARQGLHTAMQGIYDEKPVPDPHLMIMAVGDAYCDDAPIQVTQFEADIRLGDQLKRLYLEGGGGGNDGESYNLAWYYAAFQTEIDSIKKRNRKGLLFTVGDEPMLPELRADHIREFIGDDVHQNIKTRDLLAAVSKKYDVYHVIIKEGSYARTEPKKVLKNWRDLLGERVIELADHTKLAETIVSAIKVNEGSLVADAAAIWDGTTSVVVADALKNLPAAIRPARGKGIMRVPRPALDAA